MSGAPFGRTTSPSVLLASIASYERAGRWTSLARLSKTLQRGLGQSSQMLRGPSTTPCWESSRSCQTTRLAQRHPLPRACSGAPPALPVLLGATPLSMPDVGISAIVSTGPRAVRSSSSASSWSLLVACPHKHRLTAHVAAQLAGSFSESSEALDTDQLA
jgi:hypothetical protein